MRSMLSFLGFLLLLLGGSFVVHLGVRWFAHQPLWAHMLVGSYLLNFILASLILLLVTFSLRKKSPHSGFIFIGGSALKFVVFFLVFYPKYQEDGVMHTAEFTTFFIPYALCLILEVAYLSKQLNNQVY
jgi:hypothetical protein